MWPKKKRNRFSRKRSHTTIRRGKVLGDCAFCEMKKENTFVNIGSTNGSRKRGLVASGESEKGKASEKNAK